MEGLAVVAIFAAFGAAAACVWLYRRYQELKKDVDEINGLLWDAHIREEKEAELVEEGAPDWAWPRRRQD